MSSFFSSLLSFFSFKGLLGQGCGIRDVKAGRNLCRKITSFSIKANKMIKNGKYF